MSYYEDPQPSGSYEMQGTSENYYTTKWETNDPIDVDAYQPIQTGSLPVITKVESMNTESTIQSDKVFTHVCNALGVKSYERSLQAIKDELKKKFKPSLLHHPNLKSPQATWCKAIFVSQLPVWFDFEHVKTLLQLRSDFDVNWGSYYIDMFKNMNKENTGECLIRFMETKDCIQVFKDLQGLAMNGPVIVNLDLGHDIAKVRDTYHPGFVEQLRKFNDNESGQNIIVKTEFNTDEDVHIAPRTIDFNKYADIKTETDNNDVNIKQEGVQGFNRSQASMKEGGVVDMDLEEDPAATLAQEKQKDQNQSAFLENYKRCLYQKCRIVHLKNLDTAKVGFFYPTLKDFIHKTINNNVNFQYKKVMNEKCGLSGDVLLQFTKHRDADVICTRINSGKDEDLQYITSAKAPIEAIMGIGYEFKSKITTTDLRCFQLKRKLEYEGQDENLNPKKAKRDTPTSTEYGNTNNGEQTSEATVVNKHQHTPTERKRETTSNERTSRSETTESCSRQHETTASNGERTSKEKTRVLTDYPTGVLTVDERDYSAFGLSKEFMQSLGLKMPFSRTVTVSNLHPDVDEAKLMEVFSLAGEVKKIDCTPSKREAKIEFDHALEAVQALSMLDRQKLYDKPMTVRMDEVLRKKTLPQGLAGVGQGLGKHGQPLRGCRIQAELRRLYELFVDLGRMEKEVNDKTNPFKFRFDPVKQKNTKTDPKSDRNREHTIDVRDSSPEPKSSNKSSTYDLRKKAFSTKPSSRDGTPNSSKSSESSSKDPKKSSMVDESSQESTLLAIQALGTVLVAQGLIPADTDCKSLQSILGALQKKTAAQQNLQSLNIGQAQVLNQALSTVMQFMASHTPQSNPQNVAPVPVPAPVPPIPTPVPPIPTPVQPITTPVQPIPPVPPVPRPAAPNPAQSKWDIVGRTFPVLITPPTLVGQRMPATNPAPIPVKPQPRVSFPIQAKPPAPNRLVQPAYDSIRSNLREVPTSAPVAQPVKQPVATPKSTPSHQKPEPVRDTSKEKEASQTRAALEKDFSRNKESFSKSEMLVFKDLPSCVTTDILQGKMREVGELKFCEMTGKGRAFVRFKNPSDAERCIRLFHRSKVDGQIIQVSFL
ncbi:hypothetical protein O0L34_g15363 [Tuta absoluta]|nr:hypothetical protein O0L34_g15363 [Tuta absoluta]